MVKLFSRVAKSHHDSSFFGRLFGRIGASARLAAGASPFPDASMRSTTSSKSTLLQRRLQHELDLAEARVAALRAELKNAYPTTHPAWPREYGQLPVWLSDSSRREILSELLVFELDTGP